MARQFRAERTEVRRSEEVFPRWRWGTVNLFRKKIGMRRGPRQWLKRPSHLLIELAEYCAWLLRNGEELTQVARAVQSELTSANDV